MNSCDGNWSRAQNTAATGVEFSFETIWDLRETRTQHLLIGKQYRNRNEAQSLWDHRDCSKVVVKLQNSIKQAAGK